MKALLNPPRPAAASSEYLGGSRKFVIFNADDFGYSHGINRGIVVAQERGVVS